MNTNESITHLADFIRKQGIVMDTPALRLLASTIYKYMILKFYKSPPKQL